MGEESTAFWGSVTEIVAGFFCVMKAPVYSEAFLVLKNEAIIY